MPEIVAPRPKEYDGPFDASVSASGRNTAEVKAACFSGRQQDFFRCHEVPRGMSLLSLMITFH